MKMSKRQYRIGDVAKALKLKKFVLRFWEKELNLTTNRSLGGQRFYEEEDFETFKFIKSLLYDRKFTLAGAKKELELLKKTTKKSVTASQVTSMNLPTADIQIQQPATDVYNELIEIKQKLQQLQKML